MISTNCLSAYLLTDTLNTNNVNLASFRRVLVFCVPGAEAASEGEQPGLVDCTLYFVIRIGLFAYRVRLFSARGGLFFG